MMGAPRYYLEYRNHKITIVFGEYHQARYRDNGLTQIDLMLPCVYMEDDQIMTPLNNAYATVDWCKNCAVRVSKKAARRLDPALFESLKHYISPIT